MVFKSENMSSHEFHVEPKCCRPQASILDYPVKIKGEWM